MYISRRDFIKQSAVAAVASGVATGSFAEKTDFDPKNYEALRRQLRAYYPDECHGAVKDPLQKQSYEKIKAQMYAWAKANPDYDALDARQASYKAIAEHYVPFLFEESPFYFESGVNGGWGGNRPALLVKKLCYHFYKDKSLVPDEAFATLRNRTAGRFLLCCGPFVDEIHHVPPIRVVLEKGFGGIRNEVAQAIEKCPKNDEFGRRELETALLGLDTIREIQLSFAKEAKRRLAAGNLTPQARRNFARIADSAQRCPWEPPKTFYEGLNTLWFIREVLGYVDGLSIFSLGRPDAWLIDLYKADIAAGRLTKAEAADLVARFLITADEHHDKNIPVNSYDDHEMEIPITLGGCDRAGKPLYNELTRLFLDAHLQTDCVFPKLHCRISKDSPQEYLSKIGDMLMKGHAVFALFSDDLHIRLFVKDGYPIEEAREYIGGGCWDGHIDSVMDSDVANYISVVRILELSIYRDPKVEEAVKVQIESFDEAASFEEVRKILYGNFIRFFRNVISQYTRYGRQFAKIAPNPVYTMCLKGGIESRRDTTDGGVPARPRFITLGFLGNVVDSLLAINSVCFEKKICTLKEFLAAVRSNWAGERGQQLRAAAMAAPYWGDGSDASCGEMAWWIRNIYDDIDGFETDQGYKYCLAIYIYREFMYWGNKTRATPDGRRDGDRLAQGFSPSEYRCKEGVTTVLNSIASLPHDCLRASNANLTFDKSAMSADTFAAVFRVYAKKCGHLLQPNCNSVEELIDAQKHPERHQNIIVKVCGFSARFVSLSKRWQDEVIARHRLM